MFLALREMPQSHLKDESAYLEARFSARSQTKHLKVGLKKKNESKELSDSSN